jgi:hypothetical protein
MKWKQLEIQMQNHITSPLDNHLSCNQLLYSYIHRSLVYTNLLFTLSQLDISLLDEAITNKLNEVRV